MMMALSNFVRKGLGLEFWLRQEGAVLAEALVVVPFVTLFAAGYSRIRQHFLGADADRRWLARCGTLYVALSSTNAAASTAAASTAGNL